MKKEIKTERNVPRLIALTVIALWLLVNATILTFTSIDFWSIFVWNIIGLIIVIVLGVLFMTKLESQDEVDNLKKHEDHILKSEWLSEYEHI